MQPKPEQGLGLGVGLDALGDHAEPEVEREPDDGGDDDLRPAVGVDARHQTAVDLDEVDGQRAQMAQRAVAGGEVVDRRGHAEFLEPAQRLRHLGDVAQRGVLGELDADPLAGDVMPLERGRDRYGDVGAGDLHR